MPTRGFLAPPRLLARLAATSVATLAALLCLAATAQAALPPVMQDDGPPSASSPVCELVQILVNQEQSATNIYWQYGPDTSYGQQTASQPVGGGVISTRRGGARNFAAGSFDPASTTICGLTTGATYHVQAVASNAGGTVSGPDQTFVAGAPTALTGSSSNVTPTSATLSGEVNPAGQNTSYWFQYASDFYYQANNSGYSDQTTTQSAGGGIGLTAVNGSLSGASPGVVHYRLVAQNGASATPSYGVDQTVTLGAAQAYADPPTPVSGATEALNGRVDWGGLPTSYYFKYGPDLNYGSTTPTTSLPSQSGQQQVSATVAGLTIGATYHYAVVAVNGAGTFVSADQTSVAGQASVTSGIPVQTSTSSETLNGQLNPGGLPTTYHFEYGTTSAYGSQTPDQGPVSGANPVAATATAPALQSRTAYHFRLVATNAAGTVVGNDVSFTLDQTFAVTEPASAVSTTSATLHGETGAGGLNSTCWFVWGATNQYGNQTPVTNCGSSTVATLQQATITSGLAPGAAVHYAVVVSNVNRTAQGQDETFVPGSSSAVTGASTITSDSSAVLTGQVNPGGVDTTYAFQWGTTTAYGQTLAPTPPDNDLGSGTSALPVQMNLTGLTPSTTYHYRLVATNSTGPANGADQTFTTPQAPVATTTAAAGTVYDAAVLNGSINPNGFATNYHFQYATDAYYNTSGSGYSDQTSSQPAGGGNTALNQSAQVLNLSPATTYHFRIVASNGVDTVNGADQTFTTAASAVAPDVQSAQAASITDTGATVTAAINAEGQPTTYYVLYGTTTSYGSTSSPVGDAGTGSLPRTLATTVTGLTAATTYHYTVVAVNGAGTTTSPDATFTTVTPPSAATAPASNVLVTSATLNGTVVANGFPTTYHFDYGPTTAYGSSTAPQSAGAGTTPQPAATNVSGLSGNTTYHFRLVASNGPDTSFGADQTFTTPPPPQPPAVTAAAPSATDTSVTFNGAVNPSNQATTYYFNYGPTATYGQATSTQNLSAGTTSQPVTATLSGLASNTTIHFQLVALNATGQTAGPDQTVTSLAPPTAATSTSPPTATSSTAVLGGTVNPNGFATSYYFQYGTSTAYGSTVPLSSQSAGSGTSPVAVSSQAGGLAPSTTYHFRLVATNGPDVVYGSDQSFATTAPPPPTAGTTGAVASTSSSITAAGLVNPLGYPTTYYFQYGTDTGYGSATAPASAGSGSTVQNVSAVLSGLTPGTTYHFRLVTTSSGGTSYGGDQTAATAAAPPTGGGSSTGATSGSAGSSGSGGSGSSGGSGGAAGSGGGAPTISISGPAKSTLRANSVIILDAGLRLTCPRSAGTACQVTVPVTTVIPGTVVRAAGHRKATRAPARTLTLGTATVTVLPGSSAELQVTLSRQAVALLRSMRKLSATVKVTLAGGRVSSSRAVMVIMPRASAPASRPKKKH